MATPVSLVNTTRATQPSTAASNIVTKICDDSLKSSTERVTRPLVGIDPEIEESMTLAKKKMELIKQLPVAEGPAKLAFNASIEGIQADLEKVYIFAQQASSTQLKVALFHELDSLFLSLSELWLVWHPGEGCRPVIQRCMDCYRQEKSLAELITPSGSKDLYTIIVVKIASITVNANYNFYKHQPGYVPHEPFNNIYARESLCDIYNFLDSSECTLPDEKKIELFDELLDKLLLLNEATVGWMSQPNESDTQVLEKCRQKIALKSTPPPSSQEEPPFNLEKIQQLMILVTNNLCDVEKTHQELSRQPKGQNLSLQSTRIEWIPKKIRAALENDKRVLWDIYHFVIQGPKYIRIAPKDCRTIVDQLIALYRRMNQLVVTWSGKDDKDALSRMSSCESIIMSGRGDFFNEPIPLQKPTPPSAEIPIVPDAIIVVRPIKKDPAGSRMRTLFQIATAAILACLVIVAYRHLYTKK